jgi:hypothetical protein
MPVFGDLSLAFRSIGERAMAFPVVYVYACLFVLRLCASPPGDELIDKISAGWADPKELKEAT